MWDPDAPGSPRWLAMQDIDLAAPFTRDSRQVQPGGTFFATANDPAVRQLHIAEAERAGAVCVVGPEGTDPVRCRLVVVDHPRCSYAWAHAQAAGVLVNRCPVLGITGTDGKTTTAEMTRLALGEGAGRIGTLGLHDGRTDTAGSQTTPSPEVLHAFLAACHSSCPGVAIEISSHAGDQSRLAGIPLAALAYTGLGRDHLDYHGSMERYLDAKLSICDGLHAESSFIFNADDAHASAFSLRAQAAGVKPNRVVGVGFCPAASARLERVDPGYRLSIAGVTVPLPTLMPGAYNAWNYAAAICLAHSVGVPVPTALERLWAAPPVPGRCELLARSPDVYVDYAHTPDAVGRILAVLREDFPGRRLVAVFGCGGDRDRGKRGPMGRAALAADVAIITNDNSRSEDPRTIADDIIAGLPADLRPDAGSDPSRARVVVELDRAAAIDRACVLAGPMGIVAVLGKGHERNQDLGTRVVPWDDRAYVLARATGVRT